MCEHKVNDNEIIEQLQRENKKLRDENELMKLRNKPRTQSFYYQAFKNSPNKFEYLKKCYFSDEKELSLLISNLNSDFITDECVIHMIKMHNAIFNENDKFSCKNQFKNKCSRVKHYNYDFASAVCYNSTFEPIKFIIENQTEMKINLKKESCNNILPIVYVYHNVRLNDEEKRELCRIYIKEYLNNADEQTEHKLLFLCVNLLIDDLTKTIFDYYIENGKNIKNIIEKDITKNHNLILRVLFANGNDAILEYIVKLCDDNSICLYLSDLRINLMHCVSQNKNIKSVEYYFEFFKRNNISISQLNYRDETPIHIVFEKGNCESLKYIMNRLEYHQYLNYKSRYGFTPIELLINYGSEENQKYIYNNFLSKCDFVSRLKLNLKFARFW